MKKVIKNKQDKYYYKKKLQRFDITGIILIILVFGYLLFQYLRLKLNWNI